jgi:hypothetical protein
MDAAIFNFKNIVNNYNFMGYSKCRTVFNMTLKVIKLIMNLDTMEVRYAIRSIASLP